MNKKRFDTLWHGLIPGLLLPILALVLSWRLKSDLGFVEFLEYFQQMKMLSKAVSLSAIPNLLLFFIFIWTNRNFSARGVIFSTLLLAFTMVILKFV